MKWVEKRSKFNPLLSIIIVGLNARKFLSDCLNSIEKNVTYKHEVIFVDNASSDGTCAYLRENFPYVNLIASNENLGFAAGTNLGAERAKGEILLLQNSDTRIVSLIDPAVGEFLKDNRLGVLGCKICFSDGSLQPSIGYERTPLRLILSWAALGKFLFLPSVFRNTEMDERCYRYPQSNISWVSGAFLMTRAKLWKNLGGFDERYFIYSEEVDYCRRVREFDFHVAYTPVVEIVHYGGSGRKWIGARALKRTMRSYLIYTRKFYGTPWVWLVKVMLGFVMLMRAFVYFIIYMFARSRILSEKGKGYLGAAVQLLSRDTGE